MDSPSIQPVRPPLHQPPALIEILRPVVRRANRISLPVRELALDDIVRKASIAH